MKGMFLISVALYYTRDCLNKMLFLLSLSDYQ